MRSSIVLCWLLLSLVVVFAAEKPLTVAAGEEFKITLDSNPTTGYQWLMARPLDEKFLKLLGSEYKRGRSGGGFGAGGHEVLTFKARNEGKTQIHLKYARLWEQSAAARTTNFVVVITTASAVSH